MNFRKMVFTITSMFFSVLFLFSLSTNIFASNAGDLKLNSNSVGLRVIEVTPISLVKNDSDSFKFSYNLGLKYIEGNKPLEVNEPLYITTVFVPIDDYSNKIDTFLLKDVSKKIYSKKEADKIIKNVKEQFNHKSNDILESNIMSKYNRKYYFTITKNENNSFDNSGCNVDQSIVIPNTLKQMEKFKLFVFVTIYEKGSDDKSSVTNMRPNLFSVKHYPFTLLNMKKYYPSNCISNPDLVCKQDCANNNLRCELISIDFATVYSYSPLSKLKVSNSFVFIGANLEAGFMNSDLDLEKLYESSGNQNNSLNYSGDIDYDLFINKHYFDFKINNKTPYFYYKGNNVFVENKSTTKLSFNIEGFNSREYNKDLSYGIFVCRSKHNSLDSLQDYFKHNRGHIEISSSTKSQLNININISKLSSIDDCLLFSGELYESVNRIILNTTDSSELNEIYPLHIYMVKYINNSTGVKDIFKTPKNLKDRFGTDITVGTILETGFFDESLGVNNYSAASLSIYPKVMDLQITNIQESTSKVNVLNNNKVYFYTKMSTPSNNEQLKVNLAGVQQYDNQSGRSKSLYLFIGPSKLNSTLNNLKSCFDFKSEIYTKNIPYQKNGIIINSSIFSDKKYLLVKVSPDYLSENTYIDLNLTSDAPSIIIGIFQFKDFAGDPGKIDAYIGEKRNTSNSLNLNHNLEFDYAFITDLKSIDYKCKINNYNLLTKILYFFCPSCEEQKIVPYPFISKELIEFFGGQDRFENVVYFKINNFYYKVDDIILNLKGRINNDNSKNLNAIKDTINKINLTPTELDNDDIKEVVSDLRFVASKSETEIDKEESIIISLPINGGSIKQDKDCSKYIIKLVTDFELSNNIKKKLLYKYNVNGLSSILISDNFSEEFNTIVFNVAKAYNMTEEETAQFWAIIAQESGGLTNLNSDALNAQNSDKEYGMAQITPLWYEYPNQYDKDFRFEYIFNEKDLSFINKKPINLNIDLNHSACMNKMSPDANCLTKKGYNELLTEIKKNSNKYASVVWGAAFYYRLAQETSVSSSDSDRPFLPAFRHKWDKISNNNNNNSVDSIDQFFASAYKYYTTNIKWFSEGIRSYDDLKESNFDNALNVAQKKLEYYLTYKYIMCNDGSGDDSNVIKIYKNIFGSIPSCNLAEKVMDNKKPVSLQHLDSQLLPDAIILNALSFMEDGVCYHDETDGVENNCVGFQLNVLSKVAKSNKDFCWDVKDIDKLKYLMLLENSKYDGKYMAAYLNGDYKVLKKEDTDYSSLEMGDFLYLDDFCHAAIYIGNVTLKSSNGVSIDYKNAVIHSGVDYDHKSEENSKHCNSKYDSSSLINIDELDLVRNKIYNYEGCKSNGNPFSGDLFVLRLKENLSFSLDNYTKLKDYSGNDKITFLKNHLGPITNEDLANNLETNETCPKGYILIKNNPLYNTGDFCVMKYEAKKGDASTPISTADKKPWIGITQVEAKKACEFITFSGNKAHLITNDEWLTIVTSIEKNNFNWSEGSIGNGYIYSGHNDLGPDDVLEASSNDKDGYFKTNNNFSDGENQRRTLYINNSNVIWDLSGNAPEWVDKIFDCGRHPINNVGWIEYSSGIDSHNALTVLEGFNYKDLYISGGVYNSTNGIGKLYTNICKNGIRAWLRGGYWNDATSAGALALILNCAPNNKSCHCGFRCVVDPNSKP